VSSRAKTKEARRAEREQLVEDERVSSTPNTVVAGISCLVVFIALRGADLQFTWGTELFWPTLATVLVTAVFLVGLLRGDRYAWIGARWVGGTLALALIAGAIFGYPVPKVRLYAMALSLGAMVALLNTPSARAHFTHR
jgi:hypothetical protein